MDFLGGRPIRTGYHGGENDARYPSPRRLRNAIANTLDIAIVLGLFVGVVVYALVVRAVAFHPLWAAALGAVTFTVNLINLLLLPSWTGGSIGQLLTGLVRIRGADGTRPSLRETARAYFDARGVFRIGGVHTDAPHFVVVRKQDTVAVSTPHTATNRSHPTSSYLEH